MGKLNQPGYPLPAGELGDDDIVCQLVFLPDRPEYWQAFIAAYHYMTTWRAWERDTDKRGKDAAANWRAAFELTMECWRMACLQDLQDDVAAILALMELPHSCCDEGDFTDGDQYTDRVTDGEGDVPQNIIDAGYASGTSDWDGFDDYKCMISHVIVDQLVFKLLEFAPLLNETGAVLGGVAALAGILAVIVSTAGLAIVFGIVAGIGATALLYQALTDFDLVEGLSAKIVTNYDELVCAVYRSDGDQDSLDNLNDKIDELFTAPEALVLKNMNLGPTLKSLYAGRYDQQDIAEILFDAGYDLGDFTCDCEQIGEFLVYVDFESETYEGWGNQGGQLAAGLGVGGSWGYRKGTPSSDNLHLSVSALCDMIGESWGAGVKVQVHRVKYSYYFTQAGVGEMLLHCVHDGGTDDTYFDNEAAWTEVETVFDPPLESTYQTQAIVQLTSTPAQAGFMHLDNITIDCDYIPAP